MKKFYQTVAVAAESDSYTVTLDGRTIKTPDKNTLNVPTSKLAQAVADEWQKQGDEVDPSGMPMTRLVNTAIDRVVPRRDVIIDELVAYAHTDVLCYRADEPDDLVKAQTDAWDPYLSWLKSEMGVELMVTSGILPISQPESITERLAGEIDRLDGFALTAFHAFVSGLGSVVLALAAAKGFRDFEQCWQDSILEQTHQESLWGLDLEVEEKRARLHAEMLAGLDLWHFARS